MTCVTDRNCQSCQKMRQLIEENLILKKELDNLKRALMRYENPHTPSSRRMYPTRTGDHAKSEKRFPGRPKGHKGTTRHKPKAPDVVMVPDKKCSCNSCGAPLLETRVEHHIIEEIPNRQPKQVIDFLQFDYKCTRCHARETARHPDCPPEGVFGKNALTQTTLLKFGQRLPFDKVAEQMGHQYGLSMTPATALDIARRVSEYLTPEYEGILGRIRFAEVLYIDETGMKVDGKSHWMWVFVSNNETYYVLRKSRGKKVLSEVLGKDFKGHIVCDGLKSYSNYSDKLQRCWAHLLRDADWLSEQSDEGKRLHSELKELYAEVQVSLVGDPPPWLRAQIRACAESQLSVLLEKRYKSKEAKRLVGKVRNGFGYWFTFVTVADVEATNNRAERALKEPVVQRKIIGTLRNEKGTRIYELMMSLLATWKQQGLNPFDEMTNNLTAAWLRDS
jgi:transposase